MIDGEDINPSDDSCPKCGNGMVTRTCGECGGDGCTEPGELYERDPLWYDENDVETCAGCHGHGHHEWCQNCGWDVHMKGFLNGTPAIPLAPKCETLPSRSDASLGASHRDADNGNSGQRADRPRSVESVDFQP